MHIDDSESDLLKEWVVKRLEDISDADSDVLADYVLALVKSDEPDDQVRQNCQDNLEDFLKDHTAAFVTDVFAAIATKSYDPSRPPPKALQPTAPAFNPPSAPASFQPHSGFVANGGGQQGLKRTFQDDGADGQNGQGQGYGRGGDRPMKQARRGGRGGYDQRGGRSDMPGQGMPRMPTPPPGMPPFDPNNPLATLLAMQAMGLPGLPDMLPLPDFSQQSISQPPRQPGKRCRDYDTKGFCALGASCPYDHGNDHVVVSQQADEYDPANSTLARNAPTTQPRTFERGRGRGRGRGDRGAFRGGRGGRADFSSTAPNHDRSITSLVIEQIPEEKFDEQSIRDFFSQFGGIEDVNMQDYKRLAIIKFADYESACKARDSEKAIFDNRFVKVYWYKPDRLPRQPEGYQNGRASHSKAADEDVEMQEEEKIDPVEFAKKQEEAQRAHEEKLKKVKEAEAQRAELEQMMKAQAEERSKLIAKLAAKERTKAGTPDQAGLAHNANGSSTANGNASKSTSQTDALKAKLAELEKEAESMGINPNEEPWQGFPARGRGGYRGRGAYMPRGGGGWRGGRGGYAPRGGAVMRLDNRPKTVAVVFPDGNEMGPDKDEALRQYLLFNDMMESADVAAHPDRKDAAVLSFKERYLAEKFLAQAKDIPHIGKVELSWVANSTVQTPISASTPSFAGHNGDGGKDVSMDEAQEYGNGGGGRREVDYDVADDDDRWLIE